jgi:hypothetical protein
LHTSGSNAGLSFDLSTGFIEIEGVSYVQCPNNPFSPPPCDQHSNIDLGGNFDEPFQWLHEASVAYDAGLPPLPGPPDISGTFRTAGELFLLDASGGLVHFHIVGQGISQIQWLSLGSEFPPDFPCAYEGFCIQSNLSFNQVFVFQPIPEPSTLALLTCSAALALAARRWRHDRTSSRKPVTD